MPIGEQQEQVILYSHKHYEPCACLDEDLF